MRSCCSVAAIVLMALVPGRAIAQGLDQSAIVGTVSDRTRSVIVDAKVTLTGSSLIGGPRRASSSADGTFRFAALPPGSYDIEVDFRGFQTAGRRGVRLLAGATVVLDIVLEVAGISSALEVGGSSPIVDVRSTAVSTHLDQDALQALPTSRWLPSIINLIPGVAGDAAFGGAQASNGMYVDGVDITEPHFQDAVGRFNYNWIQEVLVIGLGAPAQYGEFTGVAARNIVRSGSNRFAGLMEYWTTRPSWLSHNTASLNAQLAQGFESKKLLASWDSSAQLGGPILRDRLWFFSGFERATEDSRPAGYTFTGSRREQDPRAILKITAAPASAVRFEGSITRSSYLITGDGIDPYTPIEAAWDTRQPQTSWNGGMTWTLGPHTLLEARTDGMDSTMHQDPHAPSTRTGPSPHYDDATGLYSGNVWYVYDWGGSRHTTSATLRQSVDHAIKGSHQFTFGVEIERAHSTDVMETPGGVAYEDIAGKPYLAYLGGRFSAQSNTARTTVYAQDEWNLSSHVTVSPGVRISANRGRVPSGATVFSTTPVSPRIGVAWDIGADHKTVLRAHFGRYHDPLFSSRVGSADTSEQEDSVTALVLGPGNFQEIDRYVPVNNFAIDPAITHSYVDQYVVGFERQLTTDMSVQAQFIRRNFDTFMGLIDTGSTWAPISRLDTGPDGIAGTSDDGGQLTVYQKTNTGHEKYLYTNPPGAFRRYAAVQVVGRKRYSHGWQMQASYTWSRTVGTVTNFWHSNAARYDLGNPGTFVNPNAQINDYGHAPFDFTHEVKLFGSYSVPLWGGFMVSGVYRAHTGYAWGRIALVNAPRMGNQGGVRVEPVGTRRTAAINNLDLRIEKTLHVRHQTVGLFIDAFNLGNQGVPDAEAVKPVRDVSGKTFGQPTKWVDPRSLRIGLRFTF